MPEATHPPKDKQLERVSLADIPAGQVIRVHTRTSIWNFCLTQNSKVDKEGRITDVMIMTNSKSWSPVNNQGPGEVTVDPVLEVGKVVQINVWTNTNSGYTGTVMSMSYA